jgi:hypothetical protein
MDHQSKIAGVHSLSKYNGHDNTEDWEQKHPDCLEEAREKAEEFLN